MFIGYVRLLKYRACPRGFRVHNQELAAVRRQLDDLREARDEDAGRWEFEKKKLKTDLDIAIQKSKVIHCFDDAVARSLNISIEMPPGEYA